MQKTLGELVQLVRIVSSHNHHRSLKYSTVTPFDGQRSQAHKFHPIARNSDLSPHLEVAIRPLTRGERIRDQRSEFKDQRPRYLALTGSKTTKTGAMMTVPVLYLGSAASEQPQ